jgi:hypothetical protein
MYTLEKICGQGMITFDGTGNEKIGVLVVS